MTTHELTKISPEVKRALQDFIGQEPLLITIIQRLHEKGAHVFLVGGAVRDLLLCIPIHDIDIEVHGIALPDLEENLRLSGEVNLVGKSYGVLRVVGLDVDFSVPRTDASGRKPVVDLDARLDIKEAFVRRDLTINALGIDLVTYDFIDPYGGKEDLQEKRLRATSPEKFIEDPLRFYRVMQFVGRFEMTPDDQLNQLCASMDITQVSIDRIEKEFEKMFVRAISPSYGIRWIDAIGRLKEILPELAATKDTEQQYEWHPEGSVFEHSMQALDAAARLSYDNNEQRIVILYGALCHDLGKVSTSVVVGGKIRSPGHAQAGVPLAQKMLARITRKEDLKSAVKKMVNHHMEPRALVKNNASLAAYKRLANRLAPHVTIHELSLVCIADVQGRNGTSHQPLQEVDATIITFIERCKEAGVLYAPERPLLYGRDFIDHVPAGPLLGRVVEFAYDMQINKGISDKEQLKSYVVSQLHTIKYRKPKKEAK